MDSEVNLRDLKTIINVKTKFGEDLRPYDEILPNLLLGDMPTSKNPEKLGELGVTHILNAAFGPNPNVHVCTSKKFYEELKYDCVFLGIPAIDIFTYPMSKHYETACDFIEKSLNEENAVVFVHCYMGISRSAILVIVYLMIRKGMGVLEAVKHVRGKRKIDPNNGFLLELITLDRKLQKAKLKEKENE